MRHSHSFTPPALFVIVCFAQLASAQNLTGLVTDQARAPLPDANVSLPALHRGAVTNEEGKFEIRDLSPGVYTVEVTMLGFKKETRSVTIGSHDLSLTFLLQETALELPGVIVTGKPQPTDILSSSQPVTSVSGRDLDRLRGQNVMQALETTPGVTTYTTGAGIAKPVIRGLTSQRVLVISEGTRQEGQQWGDEHAPEIDAFDVERIEVLRGPSSVLYGSDALGGVVNIIKHDLPSVEKGSPELGGDLTLNGFSNNHHVAGDLALFGASGAVGYRGHFSLGDAGNITTPEGKLLNSGLKETDGGALIGARGGWGTSSLDYSHFGQELQIHEDPAEDPEATPYQKIDHDKIHFHGDFPLTGIRLEADGAWQLNNRREFEEKDALDASLDLRLRTLSLDVRGHHAPIGPVIGTVGLSMMSQKNETLAEEKLIPGYNSLDFAGYVYEEADLRPLIFSAGVRYEERGLDVHETAELGVEAQRRDYRSVTGTIGLVYRAWDPVSFTMNVGRGWRAPTPFELFVNGVHEGTVQYLVGDATLRNEESLNIDLSARYATGKGQAELTLFRNRIGDYIFANPTGEIDSASGFDVYRLEQADATIVGVELSLQAQVTDWLILSAGADVNRGTNDLTSRPLPLMPANRVHGGAKVTTSSIGGLLNPYLSLGIKAVADQNRVELFETPTDGYTLVDLGVGGEIIVGSSRADIDLSVENLFDTAYRDHLNRFKDYALNPGRNIALKVSVPFVVAN